MRVFITLLSSQHYQLTMAMGLAYLNWILRTTNYSIQSLRQALSSNASFLMSTLCFNQHLTSMSVGTTSRVNPKEVYEPAGRKPLQTTLEILSGRYKTLNQRQIIAQFSSLSSQPIVLPTSSKIMKRMCAFWSGPNVSFLQAIWRQD